MYTRHGRAAERKEWEKKKRGKKNKKKKTLILTIIFSYTRRTHTNTQARHDPFVLGTSLYVAVHALVRCRMGGWGAKSCIKSKLNLPNGRVRREETETKKLQLECDAGTETVPGGWPKCNNRRHASPFYVHISLPLSFSSVATSNTVLMQASVLVSK